MNKRGIVLSLGLILFSAIFLFQPAKALTYQNTIGLEFTFDPLLAVTLSSDALLIDGLAPGNSASSNTITITVNTTGLTGYTLSAAVGNGTTYTDNNLTNLASPASPKPTFTSIPTNLAAVASLTTDNTWAYTLDSTNYYGLAYIHSVNNNDETWTVLNATKDVSGTAATSGCVGTCAGTANTTFTISARAAATQPSGDYTNVIQFKVISNPVPSTYSITYNQNTTDTVTNMPTNVATTNTTDSTVTLSSNTPVRAGYTFSGWCTVQPTYDGSCPGDTYDPGDDMPIIMGSSNNAITLYAIWPVYAIIYMPNASDVIGDMSSLGTTTALTNASPKAGQVSATANSTAELIAPNFYRAGYGFAGWSTDFEATSSSTIYGPNETISTNPQDDRGLNVSGGAILYPVWIAKDTTDTMQTFNSSNRCSTMPQATYNSTTGTMTVPAGSIIALEDERDHDVYAVAKLADGNCWMIENLRLDDTVNATTMAAKSQGVGGVFTALPESVDLNWDGNTSNNLYTGLNKYTLPQLNTNNTNLGGKNASNVDLVSTPGYPINSSTAGQQGTTFSWYSYGNYYSWPAAMANTTQYTGYNGTGNAGSDSAGTSICPTGWRLPKGTTQSVSGSFYYLNQQMGNNTSTQGSREWRMFPNNFVYSGYWNGSQAYDRGSNGYYWSSSAFSNGYAYFLYFSSGNVGPGTYNSTKFGGFSVRCVAGV